jgi:hypothetical protein
MTTAPGPFKTMKQTDRMARHDTSVADEAICFRP